MKKGKSLMTPDKTSPMPEHFVVLRHQEGDDFASCWEFRDQNGNPPPVCNNPAGVQSNGFNGGTSHAGWTIGYGTEFDLGKNWSAKAEYDYIDFGRKSFLANDGSLISDHPTTSQVKIGVNYRFSPGVVVAKY